LNKTVTCESKSKSVADPERMNYTSFIRGKDDLLQKLLAPIGKDGRSTTPPLNPPLVKSLNHFAFIFRPSAIFRPTFLWAKVHTSAVAGDNL